MSSQQMFGGSMRRVVKIGGSLLLRDDLQAALTRWFDRHTGSENLVIVGGGELIDAIRHLDRIRPGDPVETHWLCVDLLETTFRIVSGWFPGWPTITAPEELHDSCSRGLPQGVPTLVSVGAFYERKRRSSSSIDLPLDWRTTTDAIAGLLAIQTHSGELVLLKSCKVDGHTSLQQLAEDGVVDQALPRLESRLESIRIEKLR